MARILFRIYSHACLYVSHLWVVFGLAKLITLIRYMVFLIFMKWTFPWGTPRYPTSEAPSIITIFIKMALQPGTWPRVIQMHPFY